MRNKKKFNAIYSLQDPVTIILGTELAPIQNGSKCQIQQKDCSFQYVPLLKGLTAILMKQEIADEIICFSFKLN